MLDDRKLVGGAMAILAVATAALVVLPYLQLYKLKPPEGLKPYTEQQLRGRQVYIANGCLYCHSQQPRDPAVAPDYQRGWGRAPVPADYVYDRPHLLGTMRTGPDLFNIGARQPSADWQLGHLFQPRAFVKGSIMPPFPFLFRVKSQAESGDRVVSVPPDYAPKRGVVVATDEAENLVAYLLGLNHTYPVYREELAAHAAKPKEPHDATR